MYKLIAVVILTLVLGKVICGWVCPIGFLFELIYKLRMKLTNKYKLPTIDENIHNKLIYLKYVVFAVLLVLTAYLSIYIYCRGCPIWYLTHLHGSSLAIAVSIVALIIAFIIPMGFCRYICPLGAFFSILSIKPLFKLKTNDKCTKCKLCDDNCPMQIKISEDINQSECMRCFNCKSVCENNAINFKP